MIGPQQSTESKPTSKARLTAERLRELLEYFPETGGWRWLQVNPRSGLKAGDRAGWLQTDSREGRYGVQRWKITIDRRDYFASRLAYLWMTGEWPPGQVDHRDLDESNDKWDNLRPATPSQNRSNQTVRCDSQTGIKGVYYDRRRGLWSAQVGLQGKRIFLGRFPTADMAQAAYQAAARERHKDFFRGE